MTRFSTGDPITRRNACKGIAAIIAAGCAPSIVLAEGRSAGSIGGLQRGLGARVGMMGGDINPYDTRNHTLTAMWDAEWNVAYKQHANNGQIANLYDPNTPFIINSNGTLHPKYLAFNGLSATCGRNDFEWRTCECAFRLDSGRIVFYGCHKYQTADNSSEIMCLSKRIDGGFGGFEFCERNNSVVDYYTQGSLGVSATLARLFNSSLYKDGEKITNEWEGNTWGNQSVITIGGRVSTTAYDGIGRFYSLRLYSQYLTDEEIAYRHRLDQQRFG